MSIENTISAKRGTGEDAPTFSQTYDWPEDLNEAVDMFGETEVLTLFLNAKTVRLQANMRRPSTRKTVPTYEVYKKLVAAGMSEEDSRKISQYTGNPDGSNSDEDK